MSKTTLIVNATPNPNEAEALAYYSKHAGAILKSHNGKLVNRYNVTHTLTESKFKNTFMMMEFENDSIIKALSEGEDYQALIPYRDKAFSSISIGFIETI
jgi:uncharacterized protein (DUF1330 family)